MSANTQTGTQPLAPVCLVVEDQPEILRLIARQMARTGWHVIEAASAVEAREQIGQIDKLALAIVDLTLPDQPGGDLAQGLRARSSELPIVLTSGRAESDLVQLASSLGNAHVLCKPFSIKMLRSLAEDTKSAL